jgi:hypothetical protein
MGDALSTENLANLMSWPAAFLAFVYAAMTIGRWAVGLERLPHAMASALIAVAASGFLLRPLDALGMVENGARDTIALVIPPDDDETEQGMSDEDRPETPDIEPAPEAR